MKRLEDMGLTLTYKVAYSKQKIDNNPGFANLLRELGFELHVNQGSLHVPISLRVADMSNNMDCFVLGSNALEFGALLKWCREKGKITKCFAAAIPDFFRQFAQCIEIDENLLNSIEPEVPNEATATAE